MRTDGVLRRFAILVGAAALCAALLSSDGLVAARSAHAEGGLKVVFAARKRDFFGNMSLLQAIYTVNADGTHMKRITPSGDHKYYDWPVWALNGTKILYTAIDYDATEGEAAIYMMDPDGKNPVKLSRNPWHNSQPKLSADGKSMLFTSMWDEFPLVGLYKMDLATGLVENLSARTRPNISADADPKWTPDGQEILLAVTLAEDGTEQPTQIDIVNADGTNRRHIVRDSYYNTDADMSRNGRYVAYSSFRGKGSPRLTNSASIFDVVLHDWHIIVKDVVSGEERDLTQGLNCPARDPEKKPCKITDAPGWQPEWSPAGDEIAFLAIRGPYLGGIYVMNADGSSARPVLETSDMAISWFDWAATGTAPPGALDAIGRSAPTDRLLYSGIAFPSGLKTGLASASASGQVVQGVFSSTPDRWNSARVAPARTDLVPDLARWTPNRQSVVFTARVKVDRSAKPPAPPAGQERQIQFLELPLDDAPVVTDAAEEQIFLMGADGSGVRQLTTAQTEDYMEAIPDGEARGNTNPDVSHDNRYVVFTNRSETNGQSWILRLDLKTGEVLNLSSFTMGLAAVGDAQPRFSPDGSLIAFITNVQATTQLFTMNKDGLNVRQVTDDDFTNQYPAWSPDGKWLVYSSYRGGSLPADPVVADAATLKDWYLVKVNVETRELVQLTRTKDLAALRPVWSPDGKTIAFIGVTGRGAADIYRVDPDGKNLWPLMPTQLTQETFLDWR